MRGYPKRMATKQDYENLLGIKEFKARALEELKQVAESPDETVSVVVSGSEETKDLVTKEIPNPMPLWKQKGFTSLEGVQDLIAVKEVL